MQKSMFSKYKALKLASSFYVKLRIYGAGKILYPAYRKLHKLSSFCVGQATNQTLCNTVFLKVEYERDIILCKSIVKGIPFFPQYLRR